MGDWLQGCLFHKHEIERWFEQYWEQGESQVLKKLADEATETEYRSDGLAISKGLFGNSKQVGLLVAKMPH